MKYLICLIIAGVFTNCQMKIETAESELTNYPFYVGTYTWEKSEGIYKYMLNADGSLDSIGLVAKTESPSFLAISKDKKFLIAGNEIKKDNGQGTVESYLIEEQGLTLKDSHSSGGAHTCYVGINENNQILVANYTGGNVALMQLSNEGEFTETFDVQQHEGKGTTDRQEGPHAHSIWFVPQSKEAIAVDLGTNELWFYTINDEDGKLVAQEQAKLAMADGAGPRHLTFHPSKPWIYVLNELNGTVSQVVKNSMGEYEIIQSVSTLPEDFTEYNKCADIHFSPDGKFLYASNRGHNSLAIYKVNELTGVMARVGFESTRGDEPRNFSITSDGKYVLVANQVSNNIVSFKRNADSGQLTFVDEIYAPLPVCVLFE